MFFNLFKRKSRKQLLQEIEELKQENEELKLRNKNNLNTLERWSKENLEYHYITKNIRTLNATCVSRARGVSEEELTYNSQEYLCGELAKEMLKYVKFEKYIMIDEPWAGEVKYIATIKIIEE